MLLVISSAGAQQNASTVEALRTKILTNMNPKVPPSTAAGVGNQVCKQQCAPDVRFTDNTLNPRTLQVWVQFRIFKVLSVDLRSGRLQFKVWRRVRWFDDRLAWNPVSGCHQTWLSRRAATAHFCVALPSGRFRWNQHGARVSGESHGHRFGQQPVAAAHRHVQLGANGRIVVRGERSSGQIPSISSHTQDTDIDADSLSLIRQTCRLA